MLGPDWLRLVILTSDWSIHRHPHLGPGARTRSHSRELDRDVFAWRKVSSMCQACLFRAFSQKNSCKMIQDL